MRTRTIRATPTVAYGKSGITVCERWHDYAAFRAIDMGEKPPRMTLERKDNNVAVLHRVGENCVWVTVRRKAGFAISAAEDLRPSGSCVSATSPCAWVGTSRRYPLRPVSTVTPWAPSWPPSLRLVQPQLPA